MLTYPLVGREEAACYIAAPHAHVGLQPMAIVLADPYEVARVAAAVAREVYGTVEELDRMRIATAEVAGCLLYAIDRYGMMYEEVCQLAGRPVAEILSRLAVDNRLPAPRRRTSQIARLSEMGDPDIVRLTQIVKIAEITQVTADLFRRFVRDGDGVYLDQADRNRVTDWINDVRLMFVGFNRLERFKNRIGSLRQALSRVHNSLVGVGAGQRRREALAESLAEAV